MMAQRTVKLELREEIIEDRAFQGSIIELNYDISSTPALHPEEPYQFALVLAKHMEDGTVKKYAIYKGTREECIQEHDKLSNLRYVEKQRCYVHNSNGTPKKNTKENRSGYQ